MGMIRIIFHAAVINRGDETIGIMDMDRDRAIRCAGLAMGMGLQAAIIDRRDFTLRGVFMDGLRAGQVANLIVAAVCSCVGMGFQAAVVYCGILG